MTVSLKAIVFDVDGTLYRQAPLRRAMMRNLLCSHATHPILGYHTLRILRAYRRAQEHLRKTATHRMAEQQIALACEGTGSDRETVVACVTRWMEQEPLTRLGRCVQPGLVEFLQACQARGVRLGALSDYPVQAKLEALGIADRFDVALSSQAPEIDVLKPDPRGLLLALDRLGVSASESMYIGDRIDVDAATAQAAGTQCAIVNRTRRVAPGGAYLHVGSFPELQEILWQ